MESATRGTKQPAARKTEATETSTPLEIIKTEIKIAKKPNAVEKSVLPTKPLTVKTITEKHSATKAPTIAEIPESATSSPVLQELKVEVLGIKKEYTKSRNLCKVTDVSPRVAALNAQQVAIVVETSMTGTGQALF
ncbi:MAG: hypothetical protein ACLPN1_09150 [Dissulfurispiraceae bacterium]